MKTTTSPHTQSATCGGCGIRCSFTWPAGLTAGTHTDYTMCPCGRGHTWTLNVHL
ncbi:hypothetical protein ACIBI0_38630 [Microbispora rosea]|uniref:hypothetical protein n=1 Tax=Microbispora rosea TaxID=58117 RepID=UPI0037AD11BD